MLPPSRRMMLEKAEAGPKLKGVMPRLHGCMHAVDPTSDCHECAKVCPTGCITFPEGHLRINIELCDGCEKCVAACPHADQAYLAKEPHSAMKRMRSLLGLSQIYER